MRIDKLLANKAFGSRKEVHDLIKRGLVTINGQVCKKKDHQVDLTKDSIRVEGQEVGTQQSYYVKFHKPAGYVTAVEDNRQAVIMDLLPPEYRKMGVFPVGRLDKDTEGLLLLTNDGVWGHSLIHGKKHVPKVYEVHYEGQLSLDGLERIRKGILLGDGTQCKPALIDLPSEGLALVTIEEGKYHQVKRMMAAAGGHVIYLKRLTVGPIDLTGIEEQGQYISLSQEEIEFFKK